VLKALSDPDEEVRLAATVALKLRGTTNAIPALRRTIGDASSSAYCAGSAIENISQARSAPPAWTTPGRGEVG